MFWQDYGRKTLNGALKTSATEVKLQYLRCLVIGQKNNKGITNCICNECSCVISVLWFCFVWQLLQWWGDFCSRQRKIICTICRARLANVQWKCTGIIYIWSVYFLANLLFKEWFIENCYYFCWVFFKFSNTPMDVLSLQIYHRC